jgi:hypothetical protein
MIYVKSFLTRLFVLTAAALLAVAILVEGPVHALLIRPFQVWSVLAGSFVVFAAGFFGNTCVCHTKAKRRATRRERLIYRFC